MADNTTGFSLPFRINPRTGGIEMQSGDDKLQANLRLLLMTNAGERVMLGTYGGGARALIQEPNDEVLQGLVMHKISRAVIDWEPRVVIQGFDITQEQAVVHITIRYTRRDTGAQDSLTLEGTIS